MRRFLPAAPLLLAAGCATSSTTAYAPVHDVSYQALGQNPYWQVVIGDDAIVFRQGANGNERRWPRVLPRTVDGMRTWRSGSGADSITVSAARHVRCVRDGPAAGVRHHYADTVTVRLGEDGPALHGCGGGITAIPSGEPR